MKLRSHFFATMSALFWVCVSPQLSAQVEYELTFDATWSAATHPTDFPSGAHFSGLFGAAHNEEFSLWSPGEISTPGVKAVAEFGSGGTILQEISAGGAAVYDEVRLGGIGSPASGKTTFTLQSTHSLVSFVTMIAPSPDWIVGVHDVDLRPEGLWLPELVVDAHPYDAGTDSGASYRSSNQATSPFEGIFRLTDGLFDGTPPFGTFTLRRLTDLPDADFDDDGVLAIADIDLLGDEIARGDNAEGFDLTGDGAVNLEDRDAWLAAANVPLGDLNLSGTVDSTDLGLLLNQFHGINVAYSAGDLNSDWILDSTDLGLLLNNFGAGTAQAVPEPSSFGLLIFVMIGLAVRRRAEFAG